MYLLTFSVLGTALLTGLLFSSAMSFTAYAITFRSRRSLVVSRYTSASRMGRDTFFYARSVVLAPSLWTFSNVYICLTVPLFPGLYYANTA
jgi:hypothetical protein